MICTFCLRNKDANNFYKRKDIYATICKDCYSVKYYTKQKFPTARCEYCDKKFQLDFDPRKNEEKIPNKWKCFSCKMSLNIL